MALGLVREDVNAKLREREEHRQHKRWAEADAIRQELERQSIQIKDSGVTFADMYIFKQWKLTGEPALLIGMDSLGLLDTLIIDYRRHELQLRMIRGG